MVIDTSALFAILANEVEAAEFERAIGQAPIRLMSAASVLEAAIAVERRFGETGISELDLLFRRVSIDVRPVDLDQLDWARFAFQTYGRGRHPAGLNFGDCFSYALAKSTGEPLLFKGNDFSKTDLASQSSK